MYRLGQPGPGYATPVPASDDTLTPTELAVELWGDAENYSRSSGAFKVRKIARDLFPDDAPGRGGHWHLTPAMASAIRAYVASR